MDDYEWSAQWYSNDSWLKYSGDNGWHGDWTVKSTAAEKYYAYCRDDSYDGVRLVRRLKAGPIEIIES